ncbi:Bcr/CflA family multidrug efflux MFS transporter [Pseudoalteromonas aurantia]|uniref:Bcr/CflA family efflux transporter n=1 Tax=Pseudoalteromonas aurantia TaxID=43654 RepID=A0A5S3VAZ2_9GAMM|nr:Bcr/CflA family multidrug efflux MFS transporter [Pseudoalteromonas aurantia]TMO59777.1 Bcr/CflA family drug resistance efflux transporter [Pseudoalteromonas aurantia]TMO68678.1 Bcr/CflA family drug resistance efflux transporter [Pseudoalteromonas aurantia]TMO74962.1 Bcr/CflA family drug resistance efflux transporter [Pseudoalteromonas aurantia]
MTQDHPLGRLFLPLLASIVALTPLAIDLYLPAMLVIASDLNSNLESVQVSLSSYLGGYAFGMMVFGPLADRFSRTQLTQIGLLGFAVCSIALAITRDIDAFCVLRIVQAFFGAAATVVVPGIIRHYYKEHTAKGMSYVSMIMMVAPLIAPSLGVVLMMVWHWSAIFFVLAFYAVILFCITLSTSIDVPRFTNEKITVLFFTKNYLTVFANKAARNDILTSMLASFAFFCFLTSVPFIYLDYYRVSEQLFGVLFALNIIALMLGNLLNTRLVPKIGSRKMLYIGLFTGLLSGIAVLAESMADMGVWIIASTIAPLMMSLGIIASNADALILIAFEKHTGTATAVIGTLRFGSGALVGPLLALIQPNNTIPFATFMFMAVILAGLCQLRQRNFI